MRRLEAIGVDEIACLIDFGVAGDEVLSSLSLDPPLVLVCLDRASLTLAAVRSHGAFAVNMLAAPQRQLSVHFARRGLAATWNDVSYEVGCTGSPRLRDVLAVAECTVENYLPGGDHEIVVGWVRDAETATDGTTPLLHWRGSYTCLNALPQPLRRP